MRYLKEDVHVFRSVGGSAWRRWRVEGTRGSFAAHGQEVPACVVAANARHYEVMVRDNIDDMVGGLSVPVGKRRSRD